jgi:hypothetical protein
MDRLRIIVGGYLGLLEAGGVTWDYIQYLVGLAALGHDVFYLEDTRLWPIYKPDATEPDCAPNIAHLDRVMEDFGLAGRWMYRDEVSGKCFGRTEAQLAEICRTADVLINVSCSTTLRDEYSRIPTRVLIDTDPMFTQIQTLTATSIMPGSTGMKSLLDGHTHHFTFGESIGLEGCRIPDCGVTWKPTRQPVCLDLWPRTESCAGGDYGFTTVMNWAAGSPLHYDGEVWGQKDIEFHKFSGLPSRVPGIPIAVAVGRTGGGEVPRARMARNGWRVLDPAACCPDWRAYRRFIEDSAGEFSVAKQTYVQARTGWFSCRSACYLAAGRPVVTQDTGWSRHIPSGAGLLAFEDIEEAAEALKSVTADPEPHALAARAVAEEFFDSNRILSNMLKQVGA